MTAVLLRLVIDDATVRKHYDEHCADVAWYAERGELSPDHPDVGYRTGKPEPFDEYLADWTEGIVEELLGDHSFSYHIERITPALNAGRSTAEDTSPTKEIA